ncbi:hypothetical protein R4036_004586 [Salmonella enterica]|nr:hypothetical protein [Salmonella enterica]
MKTADAVKQYEEFKKHVVKQVIPYLYENGRLNSEAMKELSWSFTNHEGIISTIDKYTQGK